MSSTRRPWSWPCPPFLERLTSLRLGQNVIRDAGWAALRFALQGERREVLDLSSNPIPGWGPHPVTSLTYQPRLAALDLSKTLVRDAALVGLADTPALSALRTLDLSYNSIEDGGAAALAGSPYLGGLATLKLEWNRIGDAGAAALRARFGRALHLRSDWIGG